MPSSFPHPRPPPPASLSSLPFLSSLDGRSQAAAAKAPRAAAARFCVCRPSQQQPGRSLATLPGPGPPPAASFRGRSASPLSFPSGPKLCPKVFDSFPVSLPAAQCESCELAFLWIRTSGDTAESRSQGQCCHSATAGEVPGGPQTTADLLSRRVAEDAFLVPRRRGGTWDGVVPGVEGVCPPPDSCLGKGRGLRGERGPARPPSDARTLPRLGSSTAQESRVFTQTLAQPHAARKKRGTGETVSQASESAESTASVLLGAPPPPPSFISGVGRTCTPQASCGGSMKLRGTHTAGTQRGPLAARPLPPHSQSAELFRERK